MLTFSLADVFASLMSKAPQSPKPPNTPPQPPKAPKLAVSRAQLDEHLKDQVELLLSYCEAFDKGQHAMIKPMAASLRLLLHARGKNSVPLLAQLGLRGGRWRSVATHPIDSKRRPMPLCGFTAQVKNELGPAGPTIVEDSLEAKWEPNLIEPKVRGVRKILFDEWWEMPVAINPSSGVKFSRKNIVLHVADTDGGAHVDPELDQDYADFKEGDFLGVKIVIEPHRFAIEYSGTNGTPMTGANRAAIRTITHEVLLTLRDKAPQSFSRPYEWPRPAPAQKADPNESVKTPDSGWSIEAAVEKTGYAFRLKKKTE